MGTAGICYFWTGKSKQASKETRNPFYSLMEGDTVKINTQEHCLLCEVNI